MGAMKTRLKTDFEQIRRFIGLTVEIFQNFKKALRYNKNKCVQFLIQNVVFRAITLQLCKVFFVRKKIVQYSIVPHLQ